MEEEKIKNKIRAFMVCSEYMENCEIVFAKSHNDAKNLAVCDDCHYIDKRASLAPGFEDLNKGQRMDSVDFCENAELFFKNDWICVNTLDCKEICKMKENDVA